MEIPDGFYRTSIKALILDKDKKFLLCKEDSGIWEFPGGGIHFDESPTDCLVREIWEEMGLKVTKVSQYPSYLLKFKSVRNIWTVIVLFETEIESLKFKPSNECIEVKFFNGKEALKENIFPDIRDFIKMYDPKRH